MILAEAGYDQTKHDEGLNAIRRDGLTIHDAIVGLVDLYQRLYEQDAYHINCGMCEDFAHDVLNLMGQSPYDEHNPECFAAWGDELIGPKDDPDQYAYHCIVCYKGRYYDSQHPEGVDNFRNISAFD